MTMTHSTVASATSAVSSPDPATCVSPDELKQYLSGWCDDAQAERIEIHLASCPACEQALRELDIKPDTLMQSLQSTAVEKAQTIDDVPPSLDADQPVDAALAKARRLMDAPVESSAADQLRAVWQPANRELGVYELLRPLGRGGMGAVYLATHRQLKKQVAIKLLPVMSAEDSDVRARFQREIRVVGRLNHPSIVAATDAGEIDGTQFLVMEYVPGLDLSRLARLLGKLPVADACELMRQVALGLSCAHAEGVVHRDVKPSNLMLDETGRIRILDFGLAQLSVWDEASVDLTTVGQLMGTLDYMAPEQAELSGGVDYRADLYAMGATLFRLLCGRPPLAAAPNQSPLEKLRMLANHQPPKLDTLCPEAPAELAALVGSMLARSPQDRPASAAHVAEQLAAFTESADLVSLLKRAQEKEALSPEPIGSERYDRRERRERRSTGGLTPLRSPEAANSKGRSRIRRWIIAAIGFPLLFIAGIFIKLETEKGQLVIESEIANVKVQIIHDGKSVSGLSINQGTTATRLRADKYEIVIDGPSDGLTIDNNQFTLQNGATVIARIRLGPSAESASTPIASAAMQIETAAIARNEPIYEGKTLKQWLDVIATERSPEKFMEAVMACDTLMEEDSKEKISEALFKVLARSLRGTNTARVADRAFSLLSRALAKDQWIPRLVGELQSASPEYRRRLLKEIWRQKSSSISDYAPLTQWALDSCNAPADKAFPEFATDAADVLLVLMKNFPEETTFNESSVNALRNCSALDLNWWLAKPLPPLNDRYKSDSVVYWPPALAEVVTVNAIKVLVDYPSSSSHVAQASMILSDAPKLTEEQKTEITNAVNRRLATAAESAEKLAEVADIPNVFVRRSVPEFVTSNKVTWGLRNQNSARAVVVVELLDLLEKTGTEASSQSGVLALQLQLKDVNEPKWLPFSGGIVIYWPELFDATTEPNAGQATSPSDFARFVIANHPVMKGQQAPEPKVIDQ